MWIIFIKYVVCVYVYFIEMHIYKSLRWFRHMSYGGLDCVFIVNVSKVTWKSVCYIAARLWKYLTYFAVPPALVATYYHAFYVSEHHQRPEYIAYDHLRIRTKPFPWGDGNHTLFHNPEMNAIPGVGYEKDPPHH